MEVVSKSQSIENPAADSPYIFTVRHDSNLNHAKFLYGFEKFIFKTPTQQRHTFTTRKQNDKKQKLIKSIAVLVDETQISVGSFNSLSLQLVQFSYIVIRETMMCEVGEIIVRDQVSRMLSCQSCDISKNKVPNKEKDLCQCKIGSYQINGKCYSLPAEAKWLYKQKSFICDDGFTMIYNFKFDQYTCQKTPLNKLLDSSTNLWKCIDNFVEIKNQCVKIPINGYVDQLTKQIKCKQYFQLIDNQCVKGQQNEQYLIKQKIFICIEGAFRVEGVCVKPFVNSYYKQQLKKFICNDKFYLKQAGQCQKIPDLMIFDESIKKLVCQSHYYEIANIGCKTLPDTMIYNSQLKQFQCPIGTYYSRNLCRKALQNQQWSQQLKQFVCVLGSFKIKDSCLKPKTNYRFSKLAENFVCIQGFYQIGQQCLALPKNMRYEEKLKNFTCERPFQQVAKADGKGIDCLQIPENKQWSDKNKRFQCIKDYYQLKNNRCGQPKPNQKYNSAAFQFTCIDTFVRIKNQCHSLPLNSIFNPIMPYSFECVQGFYQKDQANCAQCQQNCMSCDKNSCKACKKGFELTKSIQNNGKSCKDICGDGIKFQQQCDDGNQYSGDGCSEKCKKQPNWVCLGGSPYTKDKCQKLKVSAPIPTSIYDKSLPIPQIKMLGMSHMYGKIILNIKLTYIPSDLLSIRYSQLSKIFNILTNSKLPVKTSVTYMDYSDGTFIIVYDFNKVQPIPEFIARIQIIPEMKSKYFGNVDIKALFTKINPMYMAQRESKDML